MSKMIVFRCPTCKREYREAERPFLNPFCIKCDRQDMERIAEYTPGWFCKNCGKQQGVDFPTEGLSPYYLCPDCQKLSVVGWHYDPQSGMKNTRYIMSKPQRRDYDPYK